MENELYSAIQALIALIQRTDFTRQISVNLDMGNSMFNFVLLVMILSILLGFMLGSAVQEIIDRKRLKPERVVEKYECSIKEIDD